MDGGVYAGETLDLRRKWKIENGKLEERRNAFNAEDAEDAENAEEEGEEGKAEWEDMGRGGSGFGRGFG
jgi:hypothetical protein